MSDLIDREAAISKIEPWLYSEGRGESELNMLRAVIAELKSLPAAPRWVRCEEPPKEDGWYMLCYLSKWKDGSWWIPKYPDYWTELPKEGE